jgi:hypothetical protein
MNIKRIIASGLIAGSTRFLIGSVLYLSSWVPELYQEYEKNLGYRYMSNLSGPGTWLGLILIGDWVLAIFMAVLYSYARRGLSGFSKLTRGILFGFSVWLITNVPASYHAWLIYEYPNMPNTIEIFDVFLINIISGVVLVIAYEEWRQLAYYAHTVRG